ncbi:MAG: bifunctional phosphoribosylaminoimidazolecarboxamide formyltransferase/IMP cyclohydrolase [Buchnera aphidicola (Nurudea ibofushi)]
MKKEKTIKNALISVFDKTGIVNFAKTLTEKKINLFSTSGTEKVLKNAGISSTNISKYTNFPEIMSGRIKTLHHKIYSSILARPDKDLNIMNRFGIIKMDLIVINFYPFFKIANIENNDHQYIVESIDIGGPTIVRAAAKNYKNVTIITKLEDYNHIIEEMNINDNTVTEKTRLKLACSAFQYVLNYDYDIMKYFSKLNNNTQHYNVERSLPKYLNFIFKKKQNLAYGENQYQKAGLYVNSCQNYNVTHIQGKTLSYNNVSDADAAISCIQEFNEPACVIVKHGNPCGVAISKNHFSAYISAYNSDPVSAFGGTIAFNNTLNEKTVQTIINTQFIELIVAPNITNEALIILSKKPNIRILKYCNIHNNKNKLNIKSICGAFLIQTDYHDCINKNTWKTVSERLPTFKETNDALFALKVVKHLKSNAIVYVKNLKTISIGAGQTSRIDAIKIATMKAKENKKELEQSIIASDAFFPFVDSIDIVAKQGVSCIIQPGGSIKDKDIISAVNKYKISMIFTKLRYFKH